MSTIEPDGLEQRTRVGDHAPTHRRADHTTIYDEILSVLVSRGWAQGARTDRSGGTDLPAAVAIATDRSGRAGAAAVARSARIRNHLVALASTAHLSAWNDAPDRTLADIEELLRHAAVAFPDD